MYVAHVALSSWIAGACFVAGTPVPITITITTSATPTGWGGVVVMVTPRRG
jgi:hypothetical protein